LRQRQTDRGDRRKAREDRDKREEAERDVNPLQHPSICAGDSFFHQDFESTHESDPEEAKKMT